MSDEPPVTGSTRRLLSVDALRGLTIAFMILVNDPGDGRVSFRALDHADWNGFTPTDLVFPTFLFLVGVSMILSYARREREGSSRRSYLLHALRRTAILFAIGILLNGFPLYPLHTLRIYGVLQRIALCFGIGSLLLAGTRDNMRRVWVLSAVFIGCLLSYWVLLRWVPIPGHGLPGVAIPLLDRDLNLVAVLDRRLLSGHLYEGTCDPEGLLSTVPAVSTLVLGMLTGLWLRSEQSLRRKALGLLGAGLLALLLGAAWNPWFPINKKLWTSSYVLWAGGWSLLLLTAFFYLAEIAGWRRWGPLLVFGRNAILSYVFAELLAGCGFLVQVHGQSLSQRLYLAWFASSDSPAVGSLLYSLCFVLLCWLPVAFLSWKRIYVRL